MDEKFSSCMWVLKRRRKKFVVHMCAVHTLEGDRRPQCIFKRGADRVFKHMNSIAHIETEVFGDATIEAKF